jgi:ubiquinone biosynthesis protein Coq4
MADEHSCWRRVANLRTSWDSAVAGWHCKALVAVRWDRQLDEPNGIDRPHKREP